MYSPTLSRYTRGGAAPAPVGSAPHRPAPPPSLPASALRTYDPDEDEDDELLSANELVKTLQPPPSAGGRARPPPRGGMAGTPAAHQAAGPRPGSGRGAMLTPHDYFQPPPRLPRDANWHALDGADAGALPYADVGLDALPVGPPAPGRRVKYPSPAHPHPPVAMNELPPEQSRARAYQLILEHQRQSHYHNQLQLRHYHQQQQQYPSNPMHEQQLHRQRQQQQAAVAAATAMATGPRGYLVDDMGRSDSPIAAQTQLRRRGSGSRPGSLSGAGRGGYEQAHRIHRELQPPPTSYPTRHYSSGPNDMMPASLAMSMASSSGARPAASARRRVASPASPDFDPQFDLLQFDPSGMDLYDAGDMPLSLAATSSLDVHDDLLGRPAIGHGGAVGNSGANGANGNARRLNRPMSGAPRRGAAPPAPSASPSAAMGPGRGYPARYEREMDVESSAAAAAASARRARPPPSEPSPGPAKRPKLQSSSMPRASSSASMPSAKATASTGGSTAASAKRSAAGKTAKANGTKAARGSAAKAPASKPAASTSSTPPTPPTPTAAIATAGDAPPPEQKRRCGRKSMNYSSEQKRERNRAAVKKCRQRQALKLEYLQRKAEVLQAENQALSDMLVKNVELDEAKRRSLTRGIQMDILLKIKEIFTQSLPKDFVLDADSIWDLNSVLAVSMPSRCYYGIESIKDFWRTSLRMRNKGKIRSFWAWLFRLPPGDRFSEFTIEPFSPTSSLYFISWTTKSDPPLAGSMVIMFGHGHRVTLHVECFGWLIWRYLLTNEPFPEPPME